MGKIFEKKVVWGITGVFLLWLGVRYVLPVAMPFLLGTVLALSAEPVTYTWKRQTIAYVCLGEI